MSTVHVDLSELVRAPLRSGIQRIEREAIRHWPGPAALVPCMVGADGSWRRLPDSCLEILCGDASPEAVTQEAERLTDCIAASTPLPDGQIARLLNLELFYGVERAEAHLRLAAAGTPVLWYVYDFIPFLRPDLFPQGTTRQCMHYLRGLLGIGERLAFLSQATRQDHARRIGRAAVDDMPIISPGADGLGLERQTFDPSRRDFVALGTVEPRKNPDALLRAFESLWQSGVEAPLIVAGRIDSGAAYANWFFAHHRGNPLLRVLEQPSDAAVRELLRGARALVMPSEAEGFGLPPYEAAHCGIPAIASAMLPCAPLIANGATLLPRMDQAAIADAVRGMMDDARAAAMWRAASNLTLPGWRDFGASLGGWAQQR